MIRIILFSCVSLLCACAIYSCNKIEPKQFHDNACENAGSGSDTLIIDKQKYYMSATVNTGTELWVRLHGVPALVNDSFESHWLQIRSANECYQTKSFKSRTELGETYFIIDYIVPTFVKVGYPAVWKFKYKGEEYFLKTDLR